MKILLITGSFPPMKCGVGDYTRNLAEALVAGGEAQVGVVTTAFPRIKNDADQIEIFPVMQRWDLAEIWKLVKVIRLWVPDIVHIQYPTLGYGGKLMPWLIPMISFFLGKKVVQTWHEGYSLRSGPRLSLKAIIPSGLVVVRPLYRENLRPMLRWALWNKKFEFIRNASAFPKADLAAPDKSVLRNKYIKEQKRLIVFVGFIYPHKGVELLLDIADPALDQIVIAGEVEGDRSYYEKFMRRSSDPQWLGKVTMTGFLPPQDVAALLAVADAVVLPFRLGGGEWNTSIHGAVLQGTFVLTTSLTKSGYDRKHNVYYAKVDDIEEMKSALSIHAGQRREHSVDIDKNEWVEIARQHQSFYRAVLAR